MSTRRELRLFALGFGLPFVALIGADLLTRHSPLPLWQQLTTLEDTCSYGICILIPGSIYLLTRLIVRRPSTQAPP